MLDGGRGTGDRGPEDRRTGGPGTGDRGWKTEDQEQGTMKPGTPPTEQQHVCLSFVAILTYAAPYPPILRILLHGHPGLAAAGLLDGDPGFQGQSGQGEP